MERRGLDLDLPSGRPHRRLCGDHRRRRLLPSFANVSSFATEDGLVLVDTGSARLAQVVHDDIRTWSPARLNTAVYSHGHIDHVFGVPVWEEEAAAQGWAAPEVIAHHAMPARFDRYIFTAGYNTIINRRQFGFTDLNWPTEYRYPDRTYHDTSGPLRWRARLPPSATRRAKPTTTPSPGSPTVGSSAAATSSSGPRQTPAIPRRCSATRGNGPPPYAACCNSTPNSSSPGHGFPVMGADRVRTALTDTADLLDSLVDQTLAVMNVGGRLDDAIHAVRVLAALEARPFLQPVYDEPEFIVHTVWRQYGGWWDGNPATLKPAPERALATELAAWPAGPAPWPTALSTYSPWPPKGPIGAAEGALRLAGHLVEHAWLAQPDDEGVQRARQQVFAARAARATSTMARGVFTWAANESPAPPPIRTEAAAALGATPAISSFPAAFDSVGDVDSSLTGPSPDTPEIPAPGRKSSRRRLAALPRGPGALLLTGCQLPTFGAYKGATSQARSTFRLWQGFFMAGLIVGGFVFLLILWAIFRYRRRSDDLPVQTQYHTLTEIIYTVMPILIVIGLFWADGRGGERGHRGDAQPGRPDPRLRLPVGLGVRVPQRRQGHRPDDRLADDGGPHRPDGAHLPRSYDVLHGFYVPEFNFSRYASPATRPVRPQRPAQRRLPRPVYPALWSVPLLDVLQRPLGLTDCVPRPWLRTTRAFQPPIHRPSVSSPPACMGTRTAPSRNSSGNTGSGNSGQYRRCALR